MTFGVIITTLASLGGLMRVCRPEGERRATLYGISMHAVAAGVVIVATAA